jgi:hypothetical protein
LAEGDAVPGDENWFRVLVFETFINSDRVAEGALKKGAIRDSQNRGWQHELSGRRSSLAGGANEIDGDAVGYIAIARQQKEREGTRPSPEFGYRGIAYATAGELRGDITADIQADVIHTPIENPDPFQDEAHADFVTFNSTDDHFDEIITWLQTKLKISRPFNAHPFAAGPNISASGTGSIRP